MNVMKTLISLSITAALLGGYSTMAVAKKTEEEDSVYRWGRWAVLAPAAGIEELPAFPAAAANEVGRCESSSNCPQPQEAALQPDPIVPPDDGKVDDVGVPVGYARIGYRVHGSSEVYRDYVGRIGLDDDGTDGSMGFQVTGPSAPDGDDVNLTSGSLPIVAVGTDRFRSTASGGLSQIAGRYIRGADGDIAIIEGVWRQVAEGGAYNHDGEYVWGITATNAELAALDLGGDVVARYHGATASGGTVDLNMILRGAGEGTWSGTVEGRVLAFDAQGTLENAQFISTSITNSALNEFEPISISGQMQGALVNAGNNAIGSFDVEANLGEGGVLQEADVFNAGLQEPAPEVAVY